MKALITTKRTVTYVAIVLTFCIPARTTMLHSRRVEQPKRPHITGIDYVRIYVTDVEKSLHFYSNIFGLTISCRQYRPREACLRVGLAEQRLLLQPAPTQAV